MKAAFINLVQMMHKADPDAAFIFTFRDGDIIQFGEKSENIVHIQKDYREKYYTSGI